ncbi:MAG: AbrB family transcriptional regulator [Crenarchaeota archaeon]|nr:AbrB family transcriptional regulator [Thermoproteota archaeon]
MKIAEIVRVDSKGRITIPMVVRETLNIIEGMNLILIADTESRQITIAPLSAKPENLAEIRIEFKDVPGAFAKISEKLAELGVDQVMTHCTTIKRGELAECVIVVDTAPSKASLDTIKRELLSLPEIQVINVKPLKR